MKTKQWYHTVAHSVHAVTPLAPPWSVGVDSAPPPAWAPPSLAPA